MAYRVKLRDGSEIVIEADKHHTNGAGTRFSNSNDFEVAYFRDGLIDYVVPAESLTE